MSNQSDKYISGGTRSYGVLSNSGLEGLRILVADDNEDAASSMAALLQLSGHIVETANDGEQAIRVAEATHPNVALLDLGMPKINGEDVARAIRDSQWGKGTIIIAVTGWNPREIKTCSDTPLFDAHLTKPVEFDALLTLLRAL
jgi:CheY-like chemotaxis protein